MACAGKRVAALSIGGLGALGTDAKGRKRARKGARTPVPLPISLPARPPRTRRRSGAAARGGKALWIKDGRPHTLGPPPLATVGRLGTWSCLQQRHRQGGGGTRDMLYHSNEYEATSEGLPVIRVQRK